MQRQNLFARSGSQDSTEPDRLAAVGTEPPAEHSAAESSSASPSTANSPGQRQYTGGTTLIQRIKDAGAILRLAEQLTPMKHSPSNKNEHFGKCPEPGHDDSRASFCVNTELQAFHCKGCGISGNSVNLFAMIHNMSDEDAKFALGRELGVVQERKANDADSMLNGAAYRYVWQLERKQDAVDYLFKERGLTEETIKRFGLGFCWGSEFKDAAPEQRKVALDTGLARLSVPDDPNSPLKSFMAGRITFPVKDRSGRIVGFAGRLVPGGFRSNGPKYLNSPETNWFHKSELLYGAHEASSGISKTGYAFVVEGYMDVVGLHQAGVSNAVAVMGASANEVTFKNLWSLTKRVVFCLDGDAAGEAGALRSVLAAAPTMEDGCEIAVARLPSGQDPDEFVLQHGADAFRNLGARATPLARFLMESRSGNHDLTYPEGRARFMNDANEVAGIFAKAPNVRHQIVAEARAINAASLVQVALDITGVAEDITAEDLRDAIALMQRRLDAMESAPATALANQQRSPTSASGRSNPVAQEPDQPPQANTPGSPAATPNSRAMRPR